MSESNLTCICCGREMENIMGARGHQPDDGLSFHTCGHYGSTFFDPMDGSFIQIAVCDECLVAAEQAGQIARGKPKSETMIERIAVGQAAFDGRTLGAMPRVDRERYFERARIAVRDMREPTETMVDIGQWQIDPVATYQSFIDAALSEGRE